MIQGMDVKEGMLLLIDGKVYKVILAVLRGTAQVHKMLHAGLKSIPDGHFIEKTFSPGEKVEQILPDRSMMQYLYTDGEDYYFMDASTYEQFAVPANIIGNIGQFLKENVQIQVEFYKGNPINIIFPKIVEMKVTSSPASIHEGADTTFKEVTLENNMRILAPQFIKEGDVIRVDTGTGKYVERLKSKK